MKIVTIICTCSAKNGSGAGWFFAWFWRERLFRSFFFSLSFSGVALGGSLSQIGIVGCGASSRSPLPFTSVSVLEILLAIEFFLRLGVKGKCFRFSGSLAEMQILILWFHSMALSQLHAQLKVFLSPFSLLPSFHFLIFLLYEPFGIYGPPAPLVWGPV